MHIPSMAARDRYTLDIKCPKCSNSGEVEVSEDDHPYMRDPVFRVDELPSGFTVMKTSFYRRENVIRCRRGAEFNL